MTPEFVARLIQGAHAGSLVLTQTEAVVFFHHVKTNTTVIVDETPVVLRDLPLYVLPDHPALLAETPS